MKFVLNVLLILCVFFSAFSQSNKFQTAYFKVDEFKASGFKDTDKLLEAMEAINETVQNASAAEKPKTWYYYGLINHLTFENETLSSQHPDALFKAAEGYKKALRTEDKKFADEKNARDNLYNVSLQLHNEGAKLYNAGSFEKAYKYFTEVKDIKKFFEEKNYDKKVDDSDASFYAAVSLYKMEKKDEAKKALHELVEQNYDNPAVYQILASFYTEEENNAQAFDVLGKGLQRYPNNVGLIIDEINLYLKENRGAEAIAKMEAAIALDSLNPQLYFALGDAYGKTGNNAKAEEAYRKAIQVDPQFYNAYYNLGAIFYNEGIVIHKELSENMKLTPKQHKELTEKRNELYRKALPYFEKAHELNPQDLPVLRALKEVYARLEMYDKSKEMKAKLDKAGSN